MRRARVLCLHGFRSSGAAFRGQLQSALPELAHAHEL
ncbi:MAG: hypothetical protein ABW061_25325, partial [Polyangiaceae bacterium]